MNFPFRNSALPPYTAIRYGWALSLGSACLPVHSLHPDPKLAGSPDTLRVRVNAIAGAAGETSSRWLPKPSLRLVLGFAFLVLFMGLSVGVRVAHRSTSEAAHLIGSVARQYQPSLPET